MQPVKPLNDRILVRRHNGEQTTKGGIYIPDNAQEKSMQGTVVAVGNGYRRDDGSRTPLTVTVGDTVLFGQYGGQEVKLDDQEYLILREDDVYAIVEETAVTN